MSVEHALKPHAGAAPQTWIGRSVPRLEDPSLVRGWGNYVADIAARDKSTQYAVFVRSPVASGRLLSVTAPPTVRMVTATDLKGVQPIAPVLHRPDYVTVETPILATDVVRFVGEPVALVLGRTPAEAEDAAEQVILEIEPLPVVLDTSVAVTKDSRLVHDVHFPGDPNTVVDGRITTPGYEEAVAAAAHEVRLTVSCARQNAMPLEARASHAAYEPSTGRTILNTTTQMPHVVRTGIAECLGISEDLLRVVAPDVGGAFGAKMALAREDVALVHTARALHASVAWVETREENFLASWHSREQRYDVIANFTTDGRLVALGADIVADVGAYSCHPVTYGVEPLMAMAELPGPYRIEEYTVRARAVLTNKCPIAPYRGVSRPVQTLAMERLMDVAAEQIGIDRFELRRRNLVTDYPHRTPSGLVLDQSSHQEALARAIEIIDLDEFETRQRQAREEGRYIGLGLSCFAERTGYGTPAFAARSMAITPGYEQVTLSLDPSGSVVLRIGASPHGQGLRTTLAQVVADELGVEPAAVRVVHSDTDQTPYGWGSFGSRAAVIAGGASRDAGALLRGKIKRLAAEMLECSPDDIELANGQARVKGAHVAVPLADVARLAYQSSHLLPEGEDPGVESTAFYDPGGTFSNAVHAVEVEVDPESGEVRIGRFVVVEDAGVLLNPQIVDGQVHGGIAQGIANALYEELIYDDAGNLVTTSLMDFLPPTMREVPHIEIHHMVSISDQTVTGAKGVGEGGTIGAPAAILNAISNALAPLRIGFQHMPVTPASVRRAVREAQGGCGDMMATPPDPGVIQ